MKIILIIKKSLIIKRKMIKFSKLKIFRIHKMMIMKYKIKIILIIMKLIKMMKYKILIILIIMKKIKMK